MTTILCFQEGVSEKDITQTSLETNGNRSTLLDITDLLSFDVYFCLYLPLMSVIFCLSHSQWPWYILRGLLTVIYKKASPHLICISPGFTLYA